MYHTDIVSQEKSKIKKEKPNLGFDFSFFSVACFLFLSENWIFYWTRGPLRGVFLYPRGSEFIPFRFYWVERSTWKSIEATSENFGSLGVQNQECRGNVTVLNRLTKDSNLQFYFFDAIFCESS